MEKKVINRWLVVLGAVMLQVCIGAIYSWSLFNQPLMDKFGWGNSEVVLTFSIAVFVFAFATMFSGRLQDKIGPKKVAMIGGLLYGGGLILSSTATSLLQLYIYYGVIAGAGVGFAYVCPLSTCVKWFPEKKGFITGVAVGAFGLGSLIFKSVIQFLLINVGVSATFLYLGIIYFALVIIGSQFLVLPPVGYGLNSSNAKATAINYDFTTKEMIKTKAFSLIWVMFLFGCFHGRNLYGSSSCCRCSSSIH